MEKASGPRHTVVGVESPLSVFLYLLMRDHLPVATVKWMVDQAKLPGDPKFDAPELEALADRFAEQLGVQLTPRPAASPPPPPPVDPPPPPEPPASEPRRKRNAVGEDTLAKTRAWMREQGRAIRPGELDEAIGFSTATRSLVIRSLAAEGFLRIEGHSQSRRLVVVDQAAPAPPSDATPEPPEDTPPPAPPAAAEEDEDDDTAPPSKPPAPTREGETDIELMARVSDYIKEASERGEAVWPRELESHFGITDRKRLTIIDLLAERRRVVVRKPNSPHTHYEYRLTSGMSSRAPGDDTGLGTGKSHLTKDPTLARRIEAVAERESQENVIANHLPTIKEWCRGAGSFTSKLVMETFNVSRPTANRVCSLLTKEGFLIRSGGERGPGVTYQAAESSSGNGSGPAGKRSLEAGADGSTLEGRALGALQAGGLSIVGLAGRLGVGEETARALMGRLYREGEVRPHKKAGETLYVVV